MIRIAGGRLRGRRFPSPPEQPGLRPTTAMVRESVMAMLTHPDRLGGCRFLDLCAGSGLMGLEAWSRGAAHITAVEKTAGLCRTLRRQAQTCAIPEDEYTVLQADVFLLKPRPPGSPAFDVAYCDPPYTLWSEQAFTNAMPGWLTNLWRQGWLAKDSVLLIEHPSSVALPVEFTQSRRYGDTTVSWLTQNVTPNGIQNY
ncbi:MAG: RsmD family RNA methyltransferase [Candidatus Melainabacteria bacterium]